MTVLFKFPELILIVNRKKIYKESLDLANHIGFFSAIIEDHQAKADEVIALMDGELRKKNDDKDETFFFLVKLRHFL